jgi:hypothetical protein
MLLAAGVPSDRIRVLVDLDNREAGDSRLDMFGERLYTVHPDDGGIPLN